jgi:CheY-like chemotaxis protein
MSENDDTDCSATVLVVDDDFDIRDTLADVLAEEGFDAAFAADGLEALEYLSSNPKPCVILLDWMMPRCDGAAFRAAQASNPRIADIPVVLLTADANAANRATTIGAAAFLRKPVQLSVLTDILRRHCSNGAASQGVTAK